MTPGEHTILVRTVDRNSDFNEYQFTIEVVSDLPLNVVLDETEVGDVLVTVENLNDGQVPIFTFKLHSDIGLTDLQGSFQICSISLDVCYDRQEFTFEDGESPWTVEIKPAGKLYVESDDESVISTNSLPGLSGSSDDELSDDDAGSVHNLTDEAYHLSHGYCQ